MSYVQFQPGSGKIMASSGNVIDTTVESLSAVRTLTNFQDSAGITVFLAATLDNNSKASLGQNGGQYIDVTSVVTAESGYFFTAIQVIAACVISLSGNITGVASLSLSSDTIIYGNYNAITLASGTVMGYYGVT